MRPAPCKMSEFLTIPQAKELVPKEKPQYGRPVELCCYSFNDERVQSFDRSAMKQYKPHLNKGFCNSSLADLNQGISKAVLKPQTYQDHLDPLIEALQRLPKTEKVADFVLWRGILTRLMATPFKKHEQWSFNVMRRGKTIYIEYDKEFKSGEVLSARHTAASYWGHRFENMIMCPVDKEPSLKERSEDPVNTWSEFSIVLKASMGKHRLLFSAEVDGVDVDGKTYVEVKTAGHLSNPEKKMNFYETKLITFWAQSFLAGIDKLIIGYRTHNGIIRSIENLQVSSIPGMTRGRVSWCPQSMLNFLNLSLDWLSEVMPTKPEDQVFQLLFLGDDRLELKPRPDYPAFVPATFVDASYC